MYYVVLSYRQVARGSMQVSLQPVSVDEIKEDAAALHDAGMRLVQFMIAYGLQPIIRTRPHIAPVNRKKAAREKRIEDRHRKRRGE